MAERRFNLSTQTKVSALMVSLSPKGISYGARTIGTEHFDKLSANGKYRQTFAVVLNLITLTSNILFELLD